MNWPHIGKCSSSRLVAWRITAVVAVVATAACVAGAAAAAPRPAAPAVPRAAAFGSHDRMGIPGRWLREAQLRGRDAASGDYGHITGTTVPAGDSPDASALDQATHTLYVANGNDGTVSVINAATCSATVTTGCGTTPPTVKVGSGPAAVAVNQATDTIYVANFNDGTVSVITGATCNATVTSGCGQTPPVVTVGSTPVALDVNQATNTIYVANWGNGAGTTLSVIDGRTCDGQDSSGCGNSPASLAIGAGPAGVIVDQATDTVYAAAAAPDGSQTVLVINGATCDATVNSGCDQVPPSLTVGNGGPPAGFAIDQANGTLYVANGSDGTVSIINKTTCNASVTTGCGQIPTVVNVGSGAGGIAFNAATRTVYVANFDDDTVSVLNAGTCNALTTSGCGTRPPAVRTGLEAAWVTVDAATDTVYVPNQGDNTVSVLNGATCNATVTVGCTHFPPTVPVGSGPDGVAVNDATHTVYVANSDDGTVSVINGATCNATHTSGCMQSVATVTVGSRPEYLAVDQATDSIYVPNLNDNTVSVIDGRTCNATVTSGCSQSPPTIAVAGPQEIDIDQATDTVYVGTSAGTVAVIDGKTCSAETVSGCGQTPATVQVSSFVGDVAVNQDTNTVYVASPNDNIVSVIDGNACNSAVTTGCSQPPATVADADGPGALDVDQHSNTVYVANSTDNVSMINGATCDATVTSGCGQTPPTVSAGNAPYDVAVDQGSDTVYVINLFGDSATVINGLTCNATITVGCKGPQRTVEVGGFPVAVAASSATHTAYVANVEDGDVSVFGPRG